jgi:hypothetical protein
MSAGKAGHLLERAVDPDIGVEIDDGGRTRPEEMFQEYRFDGRRKFGDIIDRGELADLVVLQADVTEPDARERLTAFVERSMFVVDQKNRKGAARMVSEKRVREDAGMSQVVTRDNGASGYQGKPITLSVFVRRISDAHRREHRVPQPHVKASPALIIDQEFLSGATAGAAS